MATIVGPNGENLDQTGVIYIKINRTDISGSNHTLSLQSLEQLRLLTRDKITSAASKASASLSINTYHNTCASVGSSSFKINNITFVLTGSAGGTNTSTTLYIKSGSTSFSSSLSLQNTINAYSPIYPYNNSLGDIVASLGPSKSNPILILTSKTPGNGTSGSFSGNYNYTVSDGFGIGIQTYFAGGASFQLISSSSILDYRILSISEFPDYYLYLIQPNYNTSYADNCVGSYDFNGSRGGYNAYYNAPQILPWTTTTTNPSGYMNTSSGYYTFGDTPNVGFNLTASAYATSTNIRLSIVRNPLAFLLGQTGNYTILASQTSTMAETLTITASLGNILPPTSSYPIEGSTYGVCVDRPSYTASPSTILSATFTLTALSASASNLPITVLSPYFSTIFRNSDCDVTMNNAIEDRVSLIYQQIDYSTSTTTPVNFQAIVSGSANYAQVNDFNYYSTPRALAKYQGAKLETNILNRWIPEDISGPGRIPNVQLLENYFIYFDWIGGTTPDLIGKSAAHVRALIDIDGNIYEPSDVGIYFDSYIRTFIKGNKVNVITRATDNSYPSNGIQSILYPYNFPVPIIASQTGSQPSETVSLTSIAFFKYPDYYDNVVSYYNSTTINSFRSLWTGSGASSYNNNSNSHPVPRNYTQLPLNGSVYANNTAITGSNNIRFTTVSNKTRAKFTAILDNVLLFNYSDEYEGNPGGSLQQQVQNNTVVTFNAQIRQFPTGSNYNTLGLSELIASVNFEVRGDNQYTFGPSSGDASGVKVYKPYTFSLSTDWINTDSSKAYSIIFKIIQIVGPNVKYTDKEIDNGGKITSKVGEEGLTAISSKILSKMGVFIPNPQLKIEQENTSYATASYNPGSSLYYWTTGSDKNILYGPQFTEKIYKQTDVGALFQAWTPSGSEKNAGYGDYIPFQIYPGDQIRFEGDESQVYNVIESYPPGNIATGTPTPTSSFYNPYLQLKLDRPIIDGTEVNSFLVRRLEVNPSFMVLDWDGAEYRGGGGFIVPQYMAKRGSDMDYNKVITSLKEKGIIPS